MRVSAVANLVSRFGREAFKVGFILIGVLVGYQ